MTTVTDIERITRVALQRNPHWILRKQWLIVPPVNHYICGFFFDRTRTAHYFRLNHRVAPLYEAEFNWGYGAQFETSLGGETWDMRDGDIAEEVALRCEQESARFSCARSPQSFLHYAADFTDTERNSSLILTHALAGNPLLAKKILLEELFRLELEHWYRSQTWSHFKPDLPRVKWRRRLRRVLSILNDGPARVEALARTLERVNLHKLDLEKHWTSPWPKRRR